MVEVAKVRTTKAEMKKKPKIKGREIVRGGKDEGSGE